MLWILMLKPYFSNQAVFPTWPKSRDKNLNILRTKWAFKMKKNAFFIIFKGLSVKQITQIVLEGESPTLSLDRYIVKCVIGSNGESSVPFFLKYMENTEEYLKSSRISMM